MTTTSHQPARPLPRFVDDWNGLDLILVTAEGEIRITLDYSIRNTDGTPLTLHSVAGWVYPWNAIYRVAAA